MRQPSIPDRLVTGMVKPLCSTLNGPDSLAMRIFRSFSAAVAGSPSLASLSSGVRLAPTSGSSVAAKLTVTVEVAADVNTGDGIGVVVVWDAGLAHETKTINSIIGGDETNFDFAFFAQSKIMSLESEPLSSPFDGKETIDIKKR